MSAATIQADALAQALAAASAIADGRGAIPILGCALLSAKDGVLAIAATDMEMAFRQDLPADGALAPLAVHATRLMQIAASMGKGATATLKAGSLLSVSGGGVRAQLPVLDAADFPSLAAVEADAVEMPAAGLLRLIVRPAHAISADETRYYLNGVSLRPDHKARTLFGEASDAHRAYRAAEPLPNGWPPITVILPRHAMDRMSKLLSALPADAMIAVRLTAGRLSVQAAGWWFATRLIDGIFPDLDRVVPRAEGIALDVRNGAALGALVQALRPADASKVSGTKLMATEDRALRLRADNSNAATIEVDVPEDVARWRQPPDFEVAFQDRYLADLLKTCPGELTLWVSSQLNPARADSAEGLGIIVPWRV